MKSPANFLLLLVIPLNFFILGSSRLGACIRTTALQGSSWPWLIASLSTLSPPIPCFSPVPPWP